MSELLRAAIVGTGQAGAAPDLTGSAADELVAKLSERERERALLLCAGAHATLQRAARVAQPRAATRPPAAPETRRPSTPRLTDILRSLLGSEQGELLDEALERMAAANLRIAPELLPLALAQTGHALRARIKPVLGQRGAWLAAQRPAWSWATDAADTTDLLADDVERRWAEGTAAERKALLTLLRRVAPDMSRRLVAETWKQDKAEQRQAFLEQFATNLGADDESLLCGMLSDRSANVRVAAARLLWRIPGSEVAMRMRQRAQTLVSYAPATGLGSKLRALVSAGAGGSWSVSLPPESYDPAWERDGIVESPPGGAASGSGAGIGKRQWWLLQLLSAVPPDVWLPTPNSDRALLLDAALGHEFGDVLLDGISSAALASGSAAWFAPAWDAWATGKVRSVQPEHPLLALTPRLGAQDAESRGLALLVRDESVGLLAHLPRPWPAQVASRFLLAMQGLRPALTPLLNAAAFAIPLELLPESVSLPEVPDQDYSARDYVRALERFQTVAALRRSIAQETAP